MGHGPGHLGEFFRRRRRRRRRPPGGEGGILQKEYINLVENKKQNQAINKKIKKGEFNFEDFLSQLESMKKMGSMKSILGMMPGMGNMSKALQNFDMENSGELKNIKSMVSSMTKKERRFPKLLNNLAIIKMAIKRRKALGTN